MKKNAALVAVLLAVFAVLGAVTTVNLTSQVTGVLPIANGGTGNSVGWPPSTFYGFAGGSLIKEGNLGDGWYIDIGGGGTDGYVWRDGFSVPDANHSNLVDFLSLTNGKETGTALGFCADQSFPSAPTGNGCTDYEPVGNFPVPGTAEYELQYIFRYQLVNNTAALVQFAHNEACSQSSASCSVTVGSTGAGNALLCYVWSPVAGSSFTSCTDGGDTFTNRVSQSDSSVGYAAAATVDSGAGGKTTVTCNLSSAPGGSFAYVCGVMEFSATGGLTFDTALSNDMTTAATSQPGVGLSLGGNDVVFQLGAPATGINSISSNAASPYSYTFHKDALGNGEAYSLNDVTAYAPSWTLSSSGKAFSIAVAFKTAPSSSISNSEICAVGTALVSVPVSLGGTPCLPGGSSIERQSIGMRYATTQSDTHFVFFTSDQTTISTTDSGTTPVAGDWVCYDFHSHSNGTVDMSLGLAAYPNGSACGALGTVTTFSSHLPTVPIMPWIEGEPHSSTPLSLVAYGLRHARAAGSIP
jgi:hypothetical protein